MWQFNIETKRNIGTIRMNNSSLKHDKKMYDANRCNLFADTSQTGCIMMHHDAPLAVCSKARGGASKIARGSFVVLRNASKCCKNMLRSKFDRSVFVSWHNIGFVAQCSVRKWTGWKTCPMPVPYRLPYFNVFYGWFPIGRIKVAYMGRHLNRYVQGSFNSVLILCTFFSDTVDHCCTRPHIDQCSSDSSV